MERTLSVPWSATLRMSGQFVAYAHADPNPSTHQDFVSTGPLGKVFRYIGNPAFTVVDDNTITFNAQGRYAGVIGEKWNWEIHSSPIGPLAPRQVTVVERRSPDKKTGVFTVSKTTRRFSPAKRQQNRRT